MALGEQIKEARETKNLSQEELAEKIGVSRQAISKWENNTSIPHGINREMLSQILDIDIASDAPVVVKTPFVAWLGWILAGVLLVAFIIYIVSTRSAMNRLKAQILYYSPLDAAFVVEGSADISEEAVKVPDDLEIFGIRSIRFFDGKANEVLPDGGWYKTNDIDNITITWIGGPADSIQMFYTPTGTETMEETVLLQTKVIYDGENTVLLSADALHSDNISTGHLYFQINIGEKSINTGTYNIYYEK